MLLFHLTLGHSQNILTFNRLLLLRLFSYFGDPQKGFVHPQTFILENKKDRKTFCSSHESDTAAAGSEFRFRRIGLCYRCGLPRCHDTVRPLLCAICSSFPKNYYNFHMFRDMKHSLYLQNRNRLEWIQQRCVSLSWDLLGSVHLLLMSLQSTADGTLFGKSWGAAQVVAAPVCVKQWNRRGCLGYWRLKSDLGTFVKWNNLDHSVPLPVGWRWQDGARFQGKLRHVLGVFSYHGPYVSILLIEELGIGGTSLGTVRGCLVR